MESKRTKDHEEKVIPVTDAEAEEAQAEKEPVEESSARNEEVQTSEAPLDEVAQLAARVAELEDQRLRAIADFENYKKRTARQYEEMVRTANERLLKELLQVADNFERALKHDDERAGERTEQGKAFRQGTEMIYTQLMDLLKKYDVTPIESLGKPFDTRFHEAMLKVDSDEFEDGVVAMEMTRGYMFGDRVLRHAQVGVSSGSSEDSETAAKGE